MSFIWQLLTCKVTSNCCQTHAVQWRGLDFRVEVQSGNTQYCTVVTSPVFSLSWKNNRACVCGLLTVCRPLPAGRGQTEAAGRPTPPGSPQTPPCIHACLGQSRERWRGDAPLTTWGPSGSWSDVAAVSSSSSWRRWRGFDARGRPTVPRRERVPRRTEPRAGLKEQSADLVFTDHHVQSEGSTTDRSCIRGM